MEEARNEFTVLGKVLGTTTGWDAPDFFMLAFYQIEFNELGRKFLQKIAEQIKEDVDYTLVIAFETGVVELYEEDSSTAVLVLNPDWSVFNKE